MLPTDLFALLSHFMHANKTMCSWKGGMFYEFCILGAQLIKRIRHVSQIATKTIRKDEKKEWSSQGVESRNMQHFGASHACNKDNGNSHEHYFKKENRNKNEIVIAMFFCSTFCYLLSLFAWIFHLHLLLTLQVSWGRLSWCA